MPNDHDDSYRAVLDELRNIHQSWLTYQREVEARWEQHRGIVNASIGMLASEIRRMQHLLDKRFQEDDAVRAVRQQVLDERLDHQDVSISVIRRRVRLIRALAIGLVVAALLAFGILGWMLR